MARRRLNDHGTVYRRADGRWEAAYFVDENGVRRRHHLYARTRAEAERRLREALGARDQGVIAPATETVGSYMRGWLEGMRPTLRPRTWERYEGVVRVHLLPSLGGVSLGKLGPHHLQRLYRALLGRGLRPATVRYVHAVIHRALEQAVRWRVLPLNPASLVSPPRLDRREMAALSPEEARQFLKAAEGERLEALFVLAVTAGLRLGEGLGLRWDAIDLDAGVLSVVGTLQRIERELVLAEPKTARSRRRVELTATAVEALRRRRTAQLQERLAAGPLWEERGLVVTDPLGRPLQPYVAQHSFAVLLRRAELRPVRFHDLRHTAATLLLSRGIHPKIVSEMLGHATIAITLDLYSHVTPSMQREAVRELDALLRGGSPA